MMVNNLQDPVTRPAEVAPQRAPTAREIAREIALFGEALPQRPPEVAPTRIATMPPTNNVPPRPREVAPPTATMEPIYSPGDPRPSMLDSAAAMVLGGPAQAQDRNDPRLQTPQPETLGEIAGRTVDRARERLGDAREEVGDAWREDFTRRDRNTPQDPISPFIAQARIGSGLQVRWGRLHTGYDLNYTDARDNHGRGVLVAPVSGVIEIEYDPHAAHNARVERNIRNGVRGWDWSDKIGYGNQIYIRETRHPDEVGNAPRRWRLAHMESFAPGLRDGDFVQQGQFIGMVGDTGKSSNEHLHMEIQPRLWGTTQFSLERIRLRDAYDRDDFTRQGNNRYAFLDADIRSPITPGEGLGVEHASPPSAHRNTPISPSGPIAYDELVSAEREGRMPNAIRYTPDGHGNAGQLASPPRPEAPAPRPINIGGIIL